VDGSSAHTLALRRPCDGTLSGPATLCLLVGEGAAVYRPRHPERTAFYRIVDAHFEHYARIHDERFEPTCGPLRSVVRHSVESFLDCGRLHGGFARLRCPSCTGEHLLAFSCQTRNFCPSCQAKRSALFADKLREQILASVPHRHFVFTIPKAIRGLFERERSLLSLLPRCAFEALRKSFQAVLGRKDARPSFANFHPHLHALVTDGGLVDGGTFLPLPFLDTEVLAETFRRLVLRRLHRAERLSEGFRDALLSWVHSGFSVYARQVIDADDRDQLERMARYLTRPPLAIGAVREDPMGQVVVETPPHPRTGATAITLDPIQWLHAVTTQIPDPRQHLVRYFGAYANRVRKRYVKDRGEIEPVTDAEHRRDDPDDTFTQSRRKSWARLLRKILEVDPKLCPRCNVEMKIVSVITEPKTVDKILAHRNSGGGHDPFEPRGPPTDVADTA
jgi:hypothetical protein